jgi:hypothetical protein
VRAAAGPLSRLAEHTHAPATRHEGAGDGGVG